MEEAHICSRLPYAWRRGPCKVYKRDEQTINHPIKATDAEHNAFSLPSPHNCHNYCTFSLSFYGGTDEGKSVPQGRG